MLSVQVEGQITYELLPDPHLAVSFFTPDARIGHAAFPPEENELEVRMPGDESYSELSAIRVEGSASGQSIKAQLAASTDHEDARDYSEIKFHLVNCHIANGNTFIQHIDGNRTLIRKGRINLETEDGWTIDIAARKDLGEVWRHTLQQESYAITHVGRIRRSDEAYFAHSEAREVLSDLYWFLSFAMASPVGIGLLIGTNPDGESEIMIEDCTIVFPAESRQTWHPTNRPVNTRPMFNAFRNFAHDPNWSDSAKALISSYTSASSGYLETRITTICSAFETIAWIHLVNEKEWISRDGYGKLNAGDTLRLLLCPSSIDIAIPASLPCLTAKAKELNMDKGPEMIYWARNRIVHPDKKNELTVELKIETFNLAMTWLELFLLHLFRYEGKYYDRISWDTKPVPWLKTKH